MGPDKLIQLLRAIAMGGRSGDALLAEVTVRDGSREPISADVAVAGLRRALVLAEETVLLPAARAEFLERSLSPPAGRMSFSDPPGLVVTAAMLEELTEIAVDVLRSYVETLSPDIAKPVTPEWRSAALQLAEAIVRQQQALEDFAAAREDPQSLHAQLADPDRERLEMGLLYLRKLRIDLYIERWRKRVASTARGRSYDIYVHLDSLDIRDALQKLFQVLSPDGQQMLHAVLDPIDADFLACTRELPVPLRAAARQMPPAWWRYRVPTAADADFEESIPFHLTK